MLMSYVWILMLSSSVLGAVFTGQIPAVGAAALEGAQKGITLTLSLAGAICLWSGLARVMERSGLSEKLTKLLHPLLGKLFPESYRDELAAKCISGNFTANLLGLGNAATPLGIRAVKQMKNLHGGNSASDEMCRLIVLNTASIQLIPSTVGALRASLGAAHAFDILPAVWISSVISVCCGLLAAQLLRKWWPA